jgi:hypothetical protein
MTTVISAKNNKMQETNNLTQNQPLQQTAIIGWVAVSERLPETNCEVLAYKANGLIAQMSFHSPFDSGKQQFHWWGFKTWLNQHSQVTHWMPMPEPPCL